MNEVQKRIELLKSRNWTLAAIADEVGVSYRGISSWQSGERYPSNEKLVMMALDGLVSKKPPPKRRYPEGHYLQRRAAGKTDK